MFTRLFLSENGRVVTIAGTCRRFGMDQFKCKMSSNIRQVFRISLCAFNLRLGRGVSPNSQPIDESHLVFRSPGNRLRYSRRESGVRWSAHQVRLHPPVEHQRRVQVPVQAVGTGGGVLLPYLQTQSIHRFSDILRDGRGAAEHLTGWHLLTLLQHGGPRPQKAKTEPF